MEIGEIPSDESLEQAHEVADLVFRPVPVLRRECEQRQVTDADLRRRPYRPADRLYALAVAHGTGQSTRIRPTTVAVHDDGDVSRYVSGIEFLHGLSGQRDSPIRRSDLHDFLFLLREQAVDFGNYVIGHFWTRSD